MDNSQKLYEDSQIAYLFVENLCGKSVLQATVIFDYNVKVTFVTFFVTGFKISSCESDNFRFTLLYWVIFC